MRNEYAKNKGYGTYFEYKLKEDYDVDLEFLNKLIDEVYTNASGKIKEILEKKQKELTLSEMLRQERFLKVLQML